MKTLQKIIIAMSMAGLVGTSVHETRQRSEFNRSMKAAQTQQRELQSEMARLQHETHSTLEQLARLEIPDDQSRTNASQVHRLRGEITLLRNHQKPDDSTLTASRLKALVARRESLEALPLRFPQFAIPELTHMIEKSWDELTKQFIEMPLEDDRTARLAFKEVRRHAKFAFSRRVISALREYLAQSPNGTLPQALSDLKPYFTEPVDDAALQRYEWLPTGRIDSLTSNPEAVLLREKAPADPEYDTQMVYIGITKVRADDISPSR